MEPVNPVTNEDLKGQQGTRVTTIKTEAIMAMANFRRARSRATTTGGTGGAGSVKDANEEKREFAQQLRDFAQHLDRNNSVVVSQVRSAISESDLKHAERIRQVEQKISSSHERVAQLIAQGRIAAAALAASQQTGDKHRVHPDRNSFQ